MRPAGIGTCDKNGRKIAVGDTVRYMAGSRRHIVQYYLVEDVPAPDIFHAMKPDEPAENGLYVRLFELEQWGEVVDPKDASSMSQEKQFCRNCGRRDLAFSQEDTVRFWEPGLCSECHRLPIIGTRYDVFTGERIEPTPTHDGKLDERGDCTVDYSPKSKAGTYVRILMLDDGAVLTSAQALSLLAWLREQEATLEQLAKEQA